MTELDNFTLGYITAALWSTTDESTPQGGEFLDANYSVEDIAPETVKSMKADCAKFQADNAAALATAYTLYPRSNDITPEAHAGCDFWLNRNGYGAGFCDEKGECFEALDKATRQYKEVHLYVGDDGKIYA